METVEAPRTGTGYPKMQSTRERILQIVQQRRQETVGGLSRQLGLAPATVRRHLDILQRDGLVAFNEIRKGTGRPEHSFFLTDRGHESQPKAYDTLLAGLMKELAAMPGSDLVDRDGQQLLDLALSRLGTRSASAFATGSQSDPVEAALTALRELDFKPAVERIPGGLRFALSNCPFRSVALATEAVCSYDTALLKGILGTKVRRESCITRGDACCQYVSGPRLPSAARG